MNIIVIDFETTGVNHKVDRIIEVAAALLQIDDGVIQNKSDFSSLVWDPSYPELSEEIIALTGIENDTLKNSGRPMSVVVEGIWNLCRGHQVEMFLAHNKAFDSNFFWSEMKRNKDTISDPPWSAFMQLPWACSIRDLPHTVRTKCRVLSHLALEYGLTVDPSDLHRAMGDVALLIRLLSAMKVDFDLLRDRLYKKSLVIKAVIPHPKSDQGRGKDKAKACGFGWERLPGTDEANYPLSWVKKVKEDEVEKEIETLGYKIQVLETSAGD